MSLHGTPEPLMVCGPSGTGKSYLIELLEKLYPGLIGLVLSTTRRPARTGEVNGVHYHFCEPEAYDRLLTASKLFMSNNIFGNLYGYNTDDVDKVLREGKIPAALVYTPIADQFVKEYRNATRMFLAPPSLEFLEERMKRRGDTPADITKRIAGVKIELEGFKKHRALFPDENIIQIVNDTSVFEAVERVRTRYGLEKVLIHQ